MKLCWRKILLWPDYSAKSGRTINPDSMQKSGKFGSRRILKMLTRYTPRRDDGRHGVGVALAPEIVPYLEV